MKITCKIILVSGLLACYASSCLANNAQMNITLVKIVDQLQEIKPLIEKASKEQSKNPRMKVHFSSWTDSNGVKHHGIGDDINLIQHAIIDAINKTAVSPRSVKSIHGDFVGN